MPTSIGSQVTEYDIFDGEFYVLEADDTIFSPGDGITSDAAAVEMDLLVLGDVYAEVSALEIGGENSDVIVGAEAYLASQSQGVIFLTTSDGSSLVNHGTIISFENIGVQATFTVSDGFGFQNYGSIQGYTYGAYLGLENGIGVNHGTISGAVGLYFDDGNADFINYGDIIGDPPSNTVTYTGNQAAVYFGSFANNIKFTNYGTLSGADTAIENNNANLITINNHGLMVGNVMLGESIQTFKNHDGGAVTGNVDLGGANDVYFGYGTATVAGSILGGGGVDTIYGGDGIDTIYGGLDGDDIKGRDGEDLLAGDEGDDLLRGGEGDDFMYGGDDRDTLFGGDGEDSMWGDDGIDVLRGGNGNDALFGGASGDDLFGGAGDDTLDGGAAADELFGGEGHDVLIGGDGNDDLKGGAGDDDLSGDGGQDEIWGGDGDDLIDGGLATDTIYGGTGNDDIQAGAGLDLVYGGDGDDVINGFGGSDDIFGGRGDDTIDGGTFNDEIYGGDGNDTIDGEGGVDVLNGGAGDDMLTGGLAGDTFVFNITNGNDTVTDFNAGLDFLDLSAFSAATIGAVQAAGTDTNDGWLLDLAALGGSGSVLVIGTVEADLTLGNLIL
ncbi:calcium-binding protein [Octadecabacter sp. R77987]|uniref:calcium-binding protein n=1 Tax=Octadecabacter sp. R77987 TaxID=3093874 RepID=UPI00366AA9BE